jgi:hypothetical protein
MDKARRISVTRAASRVSKRPAHANPPTSGRDTRDAAPGTWAMGTRRAAVACDRS